MNGILTLQPSCINGPAPMKTDWMNRRVCIGLLAAALGGILALPAWPAHGQPGGAAACRLDIEGRFVEKLALMSEQSGMRTITKPGSSVMLPAGRYCLLEAELKGGYHCFDFRSMEQGWFTLVPGQPHRLRVGAPLRPSVTASGGGMYLTLTYKLVDAEGRQYSSPRDAEPAGFKVYKDDREIGSGRFEYG